MPVIFQKFVNREDLKANPSVTYVFGDNVIRVGMGGQAGAMRGEPNAIGVATKWAPGTDIADYFSDDQYNDVIKIITRDFAPVFAKLIAGETVVIPLDGLGTGLSQLPERAPRVYESLESIIKLCADETSVRGLSLAYEIMMMATDRNHLNMAKLRG